MTNASIHVGQDVLLSMDIKDFFPSIHYKRVHKTFTNLGCAPVVSALLTRLTTYDHHLAQGFPTSSTLANIVLCRFLNRASAVCGKYGLEITTYLDDIAISGDRIPSGLLAHLEEILGQEGFGLSLEKTAVMHDFERQEVTNLVVNRKLNIPKEQYRKLNAILHRCLIHGVEAVAYVPVDEFEAHLRGKISYLSHANPERGAKLMAKFGQLTWPV
jgi:retron-type reverse transcriptase